MFEDLLNFLFPKPCPCCGQFLVAHEKVICTHCRNDLPVTDSFLSNGNPVEKVFYGRIPIEHGLALLFFEKKGITQRLLHDLKYRGNQAIGTTLGNWMASDLLQTNWCSTIDAVVPVPLHRKRLRKRGYNQVEKFGRTIAEKLSVPYDKKSLKKVRSAKTQVFKNLAARYKNASHSFKLVDRNSLVGKHILLVDDIITTGATMESCASELLKIPNAKVSLASMAITH